MSTTVIEEAGIEQCDFCGAFRNTSDVSEIDHAEFCTVLKGEKAMRKERDLIRSNSEALEEI
ncbi:hypothetical protein [uncultured Alteromonas sp.]|uniref:hypothetical protein n=1 Tax=uncultured Alteromonas sp. TaxID=179113 RepID=UPI0030D73884